MRYLPLLTAAALCAAAGAQTNVVYPNNRATVEGSSNNSYPFGQAKIRYQQIQLEAKGNTMVLLGMALRRDGVTSTNMTAGTLDLEISIGESDATKFSSTFASNWVGTPQKVYTKKLLNIPALPKTTSPEPFTVQIPFDNPGLFTGQNALLWEVVCDGTAAAGTRYMDADSQGGYVYASTASLGTGCKTNTSGSSYFTQYGYFRTNGGSSDLYFTTYRAPASSMVSALIGTKDPNVTLPGLCANIRTDAVVTLPIGTVSSTGFLTTQYKPVGAWSPTWKGIVLHTQGVALDPNQPGIKVALSQGRRITLPTTDPGNPVAHRLYAYNNPTATTGSIGSGYGVVVQFQKR